MKYRGIKSNSDEKKMAEWMFHDHAFPKHSHNYGEISDYLEWNIPFPNALMVFDRLWQIYEIEELS
jgi:uncharacterized protein YozE (UPF0346 family)